MKQPEAMEVRLLGDSPASGAAEQGLWAEEAGLMVARSGPAAEKLEVGVNRSWAMGEPWPRDVHWPRWLVHAAASAWLFQGLSPRKPMVQAVAGSREVGARPVRP